jgi:hypothetical protein
MTGRPTRSTGRDRPVSFCAIPMRTHLCDTVRVSADHAGPLGTCSPTGVRTDTVARSAPCDSLPRPTEPGASLLVDPGLGVADGGVTFERLDNWVAS